MTASTAITPFNFNDSEIRLIVRAGEPWFITADVARVLGYRDANNAGRVLDEDEKGTHVVSTPGGEQRVTIINESGLYALVLRSRKPEARKFAKWVTSEVLPAIRKTGRYETPYSVQPGQTLSAEQAQYLRTMLTDYAHKWPKEKQGAFMMQGWSKLKAHFKTDYRRIPADQYMDAVNILARHIGGWLIEYKQAEATPAPALPDASRTRAAFDAAAQAAASVQTAVFNAVLEGDEEWKFGRYLLAFIDDSAKGSPAYVRQLDHGSFTTTWPRLVRDVGTGECMCTSAELLDMAAACMQRLQQRGGPARLAA